MHTNANDGDGEKSYRDDVAKGERFVTHVDLTTTNVSIPHDESESDSFKFLSSQINVSINFKCDKNKDLKFSLHTIFSVIRQKTRHLKP